ncbi:MAG TPA: dUTP diphosphatase [Stellaceae bacterium]|nr:dUTP diphosphatase [Stellaceae bacterium]
MLDVELLLLDPRLAEWGFPHWGSDLAAGLDLFACLAEPLVLPPQAPAQLVPAGFAMRIGDPFWAAMVYPRSGQGHKRGLVMGNAVGVIDPDYEGQVMISAWNRNPDTALTIEPGERIAQMVFTRVVRPSFRVVERFATPSRRGAGGFGSTG